jgi:uncharacterized membrane protein YkoI
MATRMIAGLLVATAACLSIAVAGADEKTTLDQVPVKAREALLRLAGGAQITEVEREHKHGMVLYEAEWVVDGREVEAVVTENGDLVEMEEEIDISQLPDNIRRVVEQEFPGATSLEIERVTVVMYEIEAKVNGREKEIKVLATGKIVGREEEDDDDDDDDDDD